MALTETRESNFCLIQSIQTTKITFLTVLWKINQLRANAVETPPGASGALLKLLLSRAIGLIEIAKSVEL